MHILILDDDELVSKQLGELFQQQLGSVQVKTASEVEEFHFLRSMEHFDLLVIDCLLPGAVNGIDLVQTIQTDPKSQHIWLMSGVIGPSSVPHSLKSKINFFLKKPIDESSIQTAFNKIKKTEKHVESGDGVFSSFYKQSMSQKELLQLLEKHPHFQGPELSLLYGLCSFSKFSGKIILDSKGKSFLEFSQGNLINIQIPHKNSYFGVLLVAHGYTEASKIKEILANKDPGRIGEKIIRSGVMKPGDVHFVLKEQSKIRMSKLMDPKLSLKVKAVPAEKILQTEEENSIGLKDMRNFLLSALWAKLDSSWLKNFFSLRENYFLSMLKSEDINLLDSKWVKKLSQMLNFIDGKHSVEQIKENMIKSFSYKEEEVLFMMYYLLAAKYVVLKDSDKENNSNIEEKLIQFKQRIKKENYFELLNLQKNASDIELKDRISQLIKNFHPDRFVGQVSAASTHICSEIISYLNKIKDTLLNPEEKKKYLNQLEKGDEKHIFKIISQYTEGKELLKTRKYSAALAALDKLKEAKGLPSDFSLHYCWAYLKAHKNFSTPKEKSMIFDLIDRVPLELKYSALFYYVKALYAVKAQDDLIARQNLRKCLSISKDFLLAKIELAELDQRANKSNVIKSLFQKTG